MTQKAVANSPRTEHFADIEYVMQRFNYQEHGLVEVLIAAQESYGYLSEELMAHVAKKLHVPIIQVYSVATFYDMFTLEATGETECLICTGPACSLAGAKDVFEEARRIAETVDSGTNGSNAHYLIRECSCLGLCDQAPAALVNKIGQVDFNINGVPKMLKGLAENPRCLVCGEPRILTGTIGRLDPIDLDTHRSEGAFKALEKALTKMTPLEVIDEVKESRLTGRGGAGFPTGLKWEFARKAAGPMKYVVCNFDESEPGTFKDRVLMEGNPFLVIEGLIISAFATGATSGYIYTRGEYPKAAKIVDEALDELYAENLLGEHIMGTDFDFDVEIRHNAGAYICGEETALFESIEGKRGHPRIKPPYPTQVGLFGKPTSINNVETLAIVPSLILHGGEWFQQWGTTESVGLKLFCLSGHINKPGVVEAPLGLSVRTLVERFGGGFDGDPQAVLVGGAAGGFLRGDQLDIPLTHEDLRPLDVPIGSGSIMVFNQSVDLWQLLENLAGFFVHETCGHCAPCRLGTKQIYKILHRINVGGGSAADVLKIAKLGRTIRQTCVCGLGMTAANPALTALHNLEHAI
ncbi:MAG: NADH-quinone oxidoreductase subunit NuoF [Candidatus Promineifilaceae bacterium]|nr:NADH-quinone oxidoreductase subunit NuoF [Candidatus Promineifilaceae bacterium]